MFSEKIEKARELRLQGKSLREIAKILDHNKSSVRNWISDVQLTDEQKNNLKDRYTKMVESPNASKAIWKAKRDLQIQQSEKEIPQKTEQNMLILFAALYWGEGLKTRRNDVVFTNSDPDMIKLVSMFLRDHGKLEKSKCRLQLHDNCDEQESISVWVAATGIQQDKFKIYNKISGKSIRKGKCPYGTLNIIMYDTMFRAEIEGWIRGIKSWTQSS